MTIIITEEFLRKIMNLPVVRERIKEYFFDLLVPGSPVKLLSAKELKEIGELKE